MGMVGGASLGPGSPQPVAYGYRTPSIGKPSIDFEPKSNQLRTTVAQGKGDSKLSADYSFRPPVHPVGGGGIGETGAFVDARA
jgi:hypothetical protein